MIAVHGALFAVEPNHDELDMITPDGQIRRVADISATQGHIVSTACVYDGNFYVGNLDDFPIVEGGSKILKITPSGNVKVVATGFTTILGLALDQQHRLYVLENTTGGHPFPTPGTGKILRIHHSGQVEEIATGLSLPTGMTFGPEGDLYVSNWGFGPPGMGEIVRVHIPAGDDNEGDDSPN
jgi:sugar lactone lactonase YvrE